MRLSVRESRRNLINATEQEIRGSVVEGSAVQPTLLEMFSAGEIKGVRPEIEVESRAVDSSADFR